MQQQEATVGLDHQLNDVMALERPLRPQAGRPRHRRHRLRSTPDGNEDLRHRQPGRRPHGARVHQPERRAAQGRCATTTASSSRSTSACREQLVPARELHCGAACIGNYSGLSQSDENGRTSPNVGRLFDYPLMMFQDGGTPALRPAGDGSSAPVQDAVHLPVRLRHEPRPERVHRERPAGEP